MKMTKANLDFLKELPRVEDAGEVIACFQCSACVADCPAAAHSPRFNPRDIMLKVLLGLEDELLVEDSVVWDCTTCYTCMERCPQGVRPIEVITAVKNILARKGMLPEKIAAAAESIRSTDRVIEITSAVERHREELGLPALEAGGKRIEEVVK
jgi:heterodisulfide reductase subunit C